MIANLWPLLGVMVFGWSALSLVMAYVLETAVIGLFAMARIYLAAKDPGVRSTFASFFLIHYGLFVLVQAVFIVAGAREEGAAFEAWQAQESLAMALGFVFSHGQSFALHYVRGKGYERTHPLREMMRPYGRVIVQQCAVVGGFFFFGVGTMGPAIILVIMKTLLDAWRHASTHRPRHDEAPERPPSAALEGEGSEQG